MGFGESNRDLFLSVDVKRAFEFARKAGELVGSVLEANEVFNTLTVKTRYGLQGIKLRIALRPEQGGTLITIQGAGSDIWGAGARKGTDKFIEALQTTSQSAGQQENQ